jgi:hypothetical protein
LSSLDRFKKALDSILNPEGPFCILEPNPAKSYLKTMLRKLSLAGREYIGGENLLQAKNRKSLKATISPDRLE